MLRNVLWTCSACRFSEFSSFSPARFCPVKLSYSEFSPALLDKTKTPVIIMHGLLGSKTNWRSLAKVIAERYQRQVYTLDARNHGNSEHSEEFNFYVMAEDVLNFMATTRIKSCSIIGHSMGGKTAMVLALTKPDAFEKLIVVDISPISTDESAKLIPKYLATMQEMIKILPAGTNLSKARKLADQHMSNTISNESLRLHLISNLTEMNNELKWSANVDVIQREISNIWVNLQELGATYKKDTLFICGGNSGHVKSKDHAEIQNMFPKVEFIYINDAGHWVHSEKPSEFLNALKTIL